MKTEKLYKFDLIESKGPVFKGKCIISDPNVGGIKNTYNIYCIHRFYLFEKVFINYKSTFIGTQSFLQPYKSIWNKKANRIPNVYWGKHIFLTRIWILLSSNYNTLSNKKVIIPIGTTESEYVKVLNIRFKSTILSKLLKKNQTFFIN